jgi:uncharacterized protein
VPEGYVAQVLAPWGEPVGMAGAMPPWQGPDAGNSAAEQALQMGMHHDGLHFYPLEGQFGARPAGDEPRVHRRRPAAPRRPDAWTAEKVAKSQAAHGISGDRGAPERRAGWQVVRPSRYARRITATTPFAIGGPAAGHPLMRTAADPDGPPRAGHAEQLRQRPTPWGTYLSGEENWAGYFTAADRPPRTSAAGACARPPGTAGPSTTRFDTVRNPNEPNRFGWVVELDPMDPAARRSSAPRWAAPRTKAPGWR